MNEQFWMVWIDGKPGPTHTHFTLDDARLEAERLLKLSGNEGRRAFILEGMSFGEIVSPPVIWRTFAERS